MMSMTSKPFPMPSADEPPDPPYPVVHDRRTVVHGMDTQYLEAGTGPPLLLLHGHEQSATSWRWVIPALSRTHRVLALSLPGHGETDRAVTGYAPGADLVPFVAGFLSTLQIGAVDIVGHSVGGPSQARMRLSKRWTTSKKGSFAFNPAAVSVRIAFPKRVTMTVSY